MKGDTTVCVPGGWNDTVTYKSIEWDGTFWWILGINGTDYYYINKEVLETLNVGDVINLDNVVRWNRCLIAHLNFMYNKKRLDGGEFVSAKLGNY